MSKVSLGILYMVMCSICFAAMGYFTKNLSATISPMETLFIRSIFGLAVLVPFCKFKSISLQGNNKKALFYRGFYGSIGAICIFYAIAHAPMAESIALFRTAALHVPFLAWWLLKEKLRPSQICFAVIGFMGTILILKPDFHAISIGMLIAFIGSFFNAIAWVSVRSLANKENAHTIVIYFLATCAFITLCCFGKDFVMPNVHESLQIFMASIFGTAGQIFLTNAYKHGSAATITPIGYSEIIFVTLIGWFGFNHLPDYLSFVGITLIMISSLLIIRLSTRQLFDAKE